MNTFDYRFDMLEYWLSKLLIPENFRDKYLWAMKLMRSKNFEPALEILREIRIENNSSEARYSIAINRAICLAVQSDVNGLLQEIVLPFKLQNFVNEKGEWSTGQIILFFNQAILKTKMRMYNEASAIFEHLEHMLSNYSNNLILEGVDMLTLIKSKLAWIYLDEKKFEKFEQKLQELKTKEYYYWKLSGMRNTQRAAYTEAQELLRKALHIAPEYEKLYAMFELGRSLEFTEEEDKVKEAIKLYRCVFENAKDFELNVICSNNLGNAYVKLKQFKEAEDQFSKSLLQREQFLSERPKVLEFERTKIAIYDSMERTYRNMQKMYIAAAFNESADSVARITYIEKALEIAERGRTVVFRDHIGKISDSCAVDTMKRFSKEKNTTIIHYSYLNLHYDNMIYIYVITPDQQIHFIKVELSEIIQNTKLEDLIHCCTKINHSGSTECDALYAVTQLYNCLLRPIEKYIKKDDFLTVIPHNVLVKAPFYALFDGKQFMIDKNIIHVALCASHLCSPMQLSMPLNSKHKLLLFSSSELRTWAEQEVHAINTICKKTNTSIVEANTVDKSKFLQQIDKTITIIHIISHNSTANTDPYQEDKKHVGKIIFAKEVYVEHKDIRSVDLSNVLLAVLNICKACDGTISNDAPLGIYKAFLVSKVPTVLGTLWDVNNTYGAVFATLFYTYLLSGKFSVHEACREAMLQIKSRTAPHEFQYWAPFITIGKLQKEK